MAVAAEILVTNPTDGVLKLVLSGEWKLGQNVPSTESVVHRLESFAVRQIEFDTGNITGWDSGLLTFVKRLRTQAEEQRVALDITGLPQGA